MWKFLGRLFNKATPPAAAYIPTYNPHFTHAPVTDWEQWDKLNPDPTSVRKPQFAKEPVANAVLHVPAYKCTGTSRTKREYHAEPPYRPTVIALPDLTDYSSPSSFSTPSSDSMVSSPTIEAGGGSFGGGGSDSSW
jgi:uncharacterized membrane protein YgcG